MMRLLLIIAIMIFLSHVYLFLDRLKAAASSSADHKLGKYWTCFSLRAVIGFLYVSVVSPGGKQTLLLKQWKRAHSFHLKRFSCECAFCANQKKRFIV